MDNSTSSSRDVRLAEAHVLREKFYLCGSKVGHEAYVSVAHLIGRGIYGTEARWVSAHAAATAALKPLLAYTIEDNGLYWLHVPNAGQWGTPTPQMPAVTFKAEFAAKVEARLLGVARWAKIVPQPAT